MDFGQFFKDVVASPEFGKGGVVKLAAKDCGPGVGTDYRLKGRDIPLMRLVNIDSVRSLHRALGRPLIRSTNDVLVIGESEHGGLYAGLGII